MLFISKIFRNFVFEKINYVSQKKLLASILSTYNSLQHYF